MEDCWYNILEYIPAQNGMFVCKRWYQLLRDRAHEENPMCNFLLHWISRFRVTKLFLTKIKHDIPYRLQFFFIHEEPTHHLCSRKLPQFARHLRRIDVMRTEEYETMLEYLTDIPHNAWQEALETVEDSYIDFVKEKCENM